MAEDLAGHGQQRAGGWITPALAWVDPDMSGCRVRCLAWWRCQNHVPPIWWF